MNIEENKTVISCFRSLDFLKIEKNKYRNASKTTQKPRRDGKEQVKCDLTVLFSSIFVLTSENGLPLKSPVSSFLYKLQH